MDKISKLDKQNFIQWLVDSVNGLSLETDVKIKKKLKTEGTDVAISQTIRNAIRMNGTHALYEDLVALYSEELEEPNIRMYENDQGILIQIVGIDGVVLNFQLETLIRNCDIEPTIEAEMWVEEKERRAARKKEKEVKETKREARRREQQAKLDERLKHLVEGTNQVRTIEDVLGKKGN